MASYDATHVLCCAVLCCAALCSVCRHVPPPDPLPGDERGFVPVLAKGTMTGKRNPPGFPTIKTMSVRQPGVRWGRCCEALAVMATLAAAVQARHEQQGTNICSLALGPVRPAVMHACQA